MIRRQFSLSVVAGFTVIALLAPAAQADSGPWFRWQQGAHAPRVVQTTRVVYGHSESAAPVIAGFIGGLVIGSQIGSHVAYVSSCPPPPPPCEYEYYDPYADAYYPSLDDCYAHMRYVSYAPFVQVIDVRTGGCVDSYRWYEGGWHRGGPVAWYGGPGRHGRGHAYGHYKHWGRDDDRD